MKLVGIGQVYPLTECRCIYCDDTFGDENIKKCVATGEMFCTRLIFTIPDNYNNLSNIHCRIENGVKFTKHLNKNDYSDARKELPYDLYQYPKIEDNVHINCNWKPDLRTSVHEFEFTQCSDDTDIEILKIHLDKIKNVLEEIFCNMNYDKVPIKPSVCKNRKKYQTLLHEYEQLLNNYFIKMEQKWDEKLHYFFKFLDKTFTKHENKFIDLICKTLSKAYSNSLKEKYYSQEIKKNDIYNFG